MICDSSSLDDDNNENKKFKAEEENSEVMASQESCSDEEGNENILMEGYSKTIDYDSIITTTSHHCVAN